MDIVQSLVGGVLAEAESELVLEADPASEWRLLGLVAREAVSQPYEHVLDTVTDNPLPDLGALPGTRVHVVIARGLLAMRRFTGIVQRAEDIEQMRDGRWRIRMVLVPELWLLGLRQDCRIFPNENVVAIVREVLDAASLYPGERLQWRLADDRTAAHPSREHCAQYRETDLAFVSRILEDEGLTYYFVHGESPQETLVIADGGLAMREGVYPMVPTELPGLPVPVTAPSEAPFLAHQSVFGFGQERQITPRSVVLRDFDFTHFRSRAATQSSTAAPGGGAGPLLEIYDGAHRFRQHALEGDSGAGAPGPSGTMADIASGGRGGLLGGGLTRLVQGGIDASLPMPVAPAPPLSAGHNASRVAELRLQEQQMPANQFVARSNVLGIAPGHQIVLDDRVRNERDGAYVVLECEHRWSRPDAEHEGTTGERREPQYANTFRCLPRDVPHRPPRVTPRPFVSGTQTATVVGAPGEEMHVDAYGRVRVQFHWDRRHDATANRDAEPGSAGGDQARNVQRLCWVRCAQSWAGPGWGSMFIPRVGMEVVVTFLEGDPDRPLIVGCVYNDACPPAYEVPRNAHRSSIRTRSTPADQKAGGREGYNELRFDDHSNHEEVFLHAEKDLREVVRDHHETWIGGAQDLEVRMHQTNKVGGSREKAIAGNETNTFGGHRRTTVSRTRSTVVHGLDSLTATAGRVHTVSGFESRTIGGPHLHHVRAGGGGGPDPDAERFGRQISGVQDQRNSLETYIVEGDRRVRIDGLELKRVGSARFTDVVRLDDLLAGEIDYRSRTHFSLVSRQPVLAGIATVEDGYLAVYRGDHSLQMDDEGVILSRQRQQQSLEMSERGIRLASLTGSVKVMQGPSGAEGELSIRDDGRTLSMRSAAGSLIGLNVENINVIAGESGVVILQSQTGSAYVRLTAAGEVEIVGTLVTINGVVVRP